VSHEVKDTPAIAYASVIEDLKPLAGFSITQIGVLKERPLEDGVVTLLTRNHLPYTPIEDAQGTGECSLCFSLFVCLFACFLVCLLPVFSPFLDFLFLSFL
jgi:hypothetical protein